MTISRLSSFIPQDVANYDPRPQANPPPRRSSYTITKRNRNDSFDETDTIDSSHVNLKSLDFDTSVATECSSASTQPYTIKKWETVFLDVQNQISTLNLMYERILAERDDLKKQNESLKRELSYAKGLADGYKHAFAKLEEEMRLPPTTKHSRGHGSDSNIDYIDAHEPFERPSEHAFNAAHQILADKTASLRSVVSRDDSSIGSTSIHSLPPRLQFWKNKPNNGAVQHHSQLTPSSSLNSHGSGSGSTFKSGLATITSLRAINENFNVTRAKDVTTDELPKKVVGASSTAFTYMPQRSDASLNKSISRLQKHQDEKEAYEHAMHDVALEHSFLGRSMDGLSVSDNSRLKRWWKNRHQSPHALS